MATACPWAGACAPLEDTHGVRKGGRPSATVVSASPLAPARAGGSARGRSHVSGEQVALAGAILGDAKDSVGPGPPHQQCFSTSQSWHIGRRQGTGGTPAIGRTCAMCYSIPIIPSLREAVGQREMLLLLEQTQAVLLGLYLTHSPWQGCLAAGFSHLHKVFLQAPAPSLSQNSPIHVRSCCCHRLKSPRLKRGIFYPSCLLLSGGSPPAR